MVLLSLLWRERARHKLYSRLFTIWTTGRERKACLSVAEEQLNRRDECPLKSSPIH